MQSEVAFNYLSYSLIYDLFSHAIIERIFKFAPIFPSHLIMYTVQIFFQVFSIDKGSLLGKF